MSKEEKQTLLDIKKNTKEIEVECCVNILLNSFEEFQLAFDKLNESEQEIFKAWPIWNLYKIYTELTTQK